MAVAAVSAAGPAAASADVEHIVEAAVRLTARTADAALWPALERRDVLGRLDRAMDALAAVRAGVLIAERESGAWQGSGDRSFAAWRSRTARSGERAALAQVRQAEHLAAVPAVAAAVAQGDVTLEHAATIGRVAITGTPAQQAAVASPQTQSQLLRAAAEQDAATFATSVARWAAGLDGDALERDHQAQRSARFLQLADTPRGTLIKGQVDTMTGHRLRLALEAVTRRPAPDDDRDPGQRRADALDAIARRILGDTDTKPGAHVPPHVSLVLTEQTWHAARAERRRQAAAGGGRTPVEDPGPGGAAAGSANVGDRAGSVGGRADASGGRADDGGDRADAVGGRADDGGGRRAAEVDVAAGRPSLGMRPGGWCEPATLEDGTPVPPTELAAALCDCDLTRIVIDAAGAPVDLGRTQRLFSGPQRRAVIARDRQCAWASCGAAARWCEIHHSQWWDRDQGRTAVDLGVLLCAFHHHEVHRRDLSITRIADPPPRRGAGPPSVTAVARVRYEFRDHAGRLVGPAPPLRETSPTADGPPGAGVRAGADDPPGANDPPGAEARVEAGDPRGAGGRVGVGDQAGAGGGAGAGRSSGTGVPRPGLQGDDRADDRDGGRGEAGRRPREAPLSWTTDPVTGMRVPTSLLVP